MNQESPFDNVETEGVGSPRCRKQHVRKTSSEIVIHHVLDLSLFFFIFFFLLGVRSSHLMRIIRSERKEWAMTPTAQKIFPSNDYKSLFYFKIRSNFYT